LERALSKLKEKKFRELREWHCGTKAQTNFQMENQALPWQIKK